MGIVNSSYLGIPFTPGVVAGLACWYDASDILTITKDGSNLVSQWNDKSGNSRNLTQSSSTKQPVYSTTGLNSLPALGFTRGSFTSLFLAADLATPAFTAYVVMKPTTVVRQYVLAAAVGATDGGILAPGNAGGTKSEIWDGSGSYQDFVDVYLANTCYIYRAFSGSGPATCALYRDASALGAASPNGTDWSALYFGRVGNRTNVSNLATDGYISEILIYNNSLTPSGSSDAAIYNYLKNKWGL